MNAGEQLYNLYYKSKRINRYPITESEINNIRKNKIVYKKMPRNKMLEIPTNKLKIIKCTVL